MGVIGGWGYLIIWHIHIKHGGSTEVQTGLAYSVKYNILEQHWTAKTSKFKS